MKRLFVLVAVCVGLYLMPTGDLVAQSNYPDYDDVYVNDFAGILDPAQENQIRRQFGALKDDTGVEATVVTLDSYTAFGTDDDSFETFATSLFNAWGIGSSETNNGILLIIALEERTVIIRTGVGWESRIEAETQDIIDSDILPLLRDGRMGDGMTAGARAIADVVRAELGADAQAAAVNQNLPQATRPPAERTTQVAPPQNNSETGSVLQRMLLWIFGLFSVGIVGAGGYMIAQPPKCEHCNRDLRKLDEQQDDAFLNAGQITEERIDSVNYDVWVCDFDDYVLINRNAYWFSGYRKCPTCANKTVLETNQVVERATKRSTGLQKVTKDCKHCDFHNVSHVTLPRITENNSSGSSSFGGGSSSSGGSFGGGHSSGGGSSGSW